MLPYAFQYGLTEEQFWYGDIRLLETAKKAYERDVSYRAWWQGAYDRVAVEIGARNALASKKTERTDKWVDFVDPIENLRKLTTKKDNNVEHHKQQMWFYGLLHNE